MIGISGTSHTATPHFYYTCKGRRADHSSCHKKNVRRDHIEQLIATALRDTMLTDRAILALADAAIEYQKKNADNNEIDSLKVQLADTNRAINNLVSAIEAGIFSTATQSRLAELEIQQRDLTRLLTVAQEKAEQLLTRDEIIAALKLFQDGDVNDKDYQEALIDTFLVAAYIYDDTVKIVFNLGGKQKDFTIPFNIDDVDLSGDCISSRKVDQIGKSTLRVGFLICVG